MSAEAVIAVARSDLGYKEAGNNVTKYWEAYDPSFQGQPWCVSCQWDWFRRAGEAAAFMGGGKTASCGILLRWYRAMGQTVDITQVCPGDILILDFSGRKADTQHCGLVTEVGWISNGVVGWMRTIEGNTSKSGSQANGGEVCEKVRYPSQIVAVCRPKYKEEEMPKDDITGHWAQQSIQWAKEHKLMEGFPDGSFRPNDPVLRGEEATINYRLYELFTKELVELRKEIARLREEIRQIRGEDDLK